MIKINIEITKDIKNGIIVPQNDLIANLIVKNSSHILKGCCEIRITPILEGKKEKYWEKILNAKWNYMDIFGNVCVLITQYNRHFFSFMI